MALTPEELRKRIPQWSLESDGQLLQYMKQISKNLQDKCKQTQDNLNHLLLEADECQIRFANASNSFNGIQQVKFVENRVKDDDESFYSVREEEVEKGEKHPYGEIFQMTVEKSIESMYKCFEKVTVQLASDSDSDDDDDDEEAAARNTVLRAIQKYPYISRPLPHIIGSQEWREKWHAGLIDSEEESEAEIKEQYSDSSDSDRLFPSQTNSNHTPSESEGSVWGVHSEPRRRAPSMDPSVSGDDTLSVHSTSSSVRPPGMRSLSQQSKVHVLPTIQPLKPPALFPDQPPDDTVSVSSRSKVHNLFEESDEDESTPTHRPQVQPTKVQPSYFRGNQPARQQVNLFSDEPPPSVPNYEPTPKSSTSTSKSRQRKPVNLFIESDDDDDLLNNNRSSKRTSVYQSEPPEMVEPAKKTVNLFDDDDNGKNQRQPDIGKTVGANIFDAANNNPSEEDDLFVPVQKSINGNAESRGVRRITNLFDDEPPVDDFDEIFKPKPIYRKPAGGKLVLPVLPKVGGAGEKKLGVESDKKANLFKDENDDSKEFGQKTSVDLQQNSEPVAKSLAEPTSKKMVNLFDDADDEQDIFGTNVVVDTQKPVVAMTSSILESKRRVNLFDSDEDDPVEEATNKKNFNVKSAELEKVTLASPADSSSIRSAILKKKSIFDSESEEDEGDDFLFANKTTNTVKHEPEPLPRKVVAVLQQETIVNSPVNEFLGANTDTISVTGNHKYKPKIPDEPPEMDSPELSLGYQPNNMHISNDIDYHLTTNKIALPSEELNQNEAQIQTEPVSIFKDDQLAENKNILVNDRLVPSSNDTSDSIPTVSVPSEENFDHTSTSKSALVFSSVGLFDDVPPPDDDDYEEHRTSLAVDHADDGFLGARLSTESNNSSNGNSSRYFFLDDDGPPPDDLGRHTYRDEVDDYKVNSRLQGISNITDERNRNELGYANISAKTKINRLSAKVNINVNALLPGARRPPLLTDKKESDAAVVVPTTSRATDQSEFGEQPKTQNKQTDSSTKLVGLNKGRARIQTKRKPSTRQNRRVNFENSSAVQSTHHEEPTSNNGTAREEAPVKEIRVVDGSEGKTHHVEVTAAHFNVNHLLSDELVEKLSQSKMDYDDIGADKDSRSNPVTTVPKTTTSSALVEPLSNSPKTDRLKTLSSSKLFSESESDDDDLFKTISKPSTGLLFNKPVAVPKQEIVPPATISVPASSKSKISQSIFDDSDNDEDGLFGKSKSNTPAFPVATSATGIKVTSQKPASQNRSIFGSDDDDDSDNIFGGAKRKPLTKSEPPLIAGKATASAPTFASKPLFGDEDENDEDLFGSKRKPQVKPISSQPEIKKVDKPRSKTVASAYDDPLADLLGS
ncbi:WASH complex subunit 2 [Topomyia yanbarensis]|uniref:WASH complex subunit 2 n=1 Tax=Topomyia yanbarensis TaxID=2498891 RepID=UPI00273BC1AA|nr:WASH complex subunit 2 [Topomyia yanbarensis]